MSSNLNTHPSTMVSAIVPPILWAVLIFLFSSQAILPSLDISWIDFIAKKLAHITVYAILYFLVYRSIHLLFPKLEPASHWYWTGPFVICLLYAFSDELHQTFVPGRYGSLRDIGYDMLGSFAIFSKLFGYI